MHEVLRRVAIQAETLESGGRVYVARDLDSPGLMAHGDDPDAAAASLEEARALRSELTHQASAPAGPEVQATPVLVAFDKSSATIARPYSRTP